VATVLRAAGLDPTVTVGGKMAALGSNARLGGGDLLVAEADESDGSFLRLTPTIAVVTNIDPEHLDYWGDYASLKRGFVEFCARIPFYGLSVVCLDNPAVQSILPELHGRIVTYGVSPQADYSVRGVQYRGMQTVFNAYRRGESLGGFQLRMPGAHNVLNCLAAIAVADELGVPRDVTKEALATFSGVGRRFSVVGELCDITLIDDYAHHPTEIIATLDAARRAFPAERHRIIAVFQPHRYTRTRDLFDEFTSAFNHTDQLIVSEVYPAGEAPIEGITAEALAAAIAKHGHHGVSFQPDREALGEQIWALARPGDVIMSLGAGDINRTLDEVRTRLETDGLAASDSETETP
jgi:UDP-N-acetylmuramate--alanine ligase